MLPKNSTGKEARRIIGDNINRRTYENILNAGFSPRDIVVDDIWADIVKLFKITNNKAGGRLHKLMNKSATRQANG